MQAMLLLFVFMGVLAGYVSSRLYKSFNGIAWKRNTILTSLMFPGVVFFVFFVLNFFVWGKGSSGAVPFGTPKPLLSPLGLCGAHSECHRSTPGSLYRSGKST